MEEVRSFIGWHHKKVEAAIDIELAENIIPQVAALIDAAAQRITELPSFEKSPFAKEFSAELLIKGLASLLALSSFDDCETARPVMLEPTFVNYWFGLEDEVDASE